MARRKKRKQAEIGYCSICGSHGELSFEHVPPKAAYNKETLIGYEWLEHIQNRKSKKTAIQGGAGAYTLCEDCNTKTGSWYANEYVKWARTCHHIMVTWSKSNVQFGTVGLRDVYPLRFLKQVVTCFFSLIGSEGQAKFAKTNPELVSFVLSHWPNEMSEVQ